MQRSPHREGLDGVVVRLRLRHALVHPLIRNGVVLLFLRALALDALEGDDFVERDRREDQRGGGGEERSRRLRGSDIETTRRWRVSAQSRSQVKNQRKPLGLRDAPPSLVSSAASRARPTSSGRATDVIPKIVEFWAHVGWYAVERDRRDEGGFVMDFPPT